jgi:hypothetical protein
MVARKFPSRGRQAVGSFIILRLISPSIVAPEAANLNIGGLNSSGRRTLVDISKLITNLANESTEYALFRSSENVARMVALLDSLQVSSFLDQIGVYLCSVSRSDRFPLRSLPRQAAPAPNAPPVQLVCTSQPDDSFDELYLTHVSTVRVHEEKTALRRVHEAADGGEAGLVLRRIQERLGRGLSWLSLFPTTHSRALKADLLVRARRARRSTYSTAAVSNWSISIFCSATSCRRVIYPILSLLR